MVFEGITENTIIFIIGIIVTFLGFRRSLRLWIKQRIIRREKKELMLTHLQ